MEVIFKKRYSCYDAFVRSIRNPKSKYIYVHALKQFLDFCQFSNYEQLLQMSDSEKFEAIKQFLIFQESEKQLAPASIAVSYYGIKLFYESNNVLLNWKQLSRTKPRHKRVVDDRLYNNEEIRRFFDYGDLRDKVVVLILLSTGMRVGGLASLRLKDMHYIDKYRLYSFLVYADDLAERYITFCTPECATYINLYLDYRRQTLNETLTDHSPLIATTSDLKGNKFLQVDSVKRIIGRLQHHANIFHTSRLLPDRSNKGRIHKPAMQCHSFRKIFNTKCIENNLNYTVKESLLGHKKNMGLDVHYFRPSENQLLTEYLKVIDSLTVNEENRLKKENRKLKQELDLTDRQIQSMKDNLLIIAKKVGLNVDELTSKFYDSQ